jgi:hypothetical protein
VRNTTEFPQHVVARYVTGRRRPSVVGLWGNRYPPRIAVSLMAHDWAGRLKLTEPDRNPTPSPSRHWLTYAVVTLFLLAAVAVTGALASHSRDAWWQKYLNLVVKP